MGNQSSNKIPTRQDIRRFKDKIVRWFDKNMRSYPWRETRDPFRVLIAEMMLRRTKADQVKLVYEQLFSKYPDVEAMAEAEEDDIEKILYPLGLKWRAPAFSLVAREVREKYQCKVPETREELKSLPGVGEYVAGAVLSVAYNKKEWIVDSNIVRVFKRYFGIKTSREGRRDKHVTNMAKIYVSVKKPGESNLALLDFSALVCTPRNPKCGLCPLTKTCHHYSLKDNRRMPEVDYGLPT